MKVKSFLIKANAQLSRISSSAEALQSASDWAATAAAKSLQLCPTLWDPIDWSPPGSPSLGFSRQEHWSGLPFPSPIRESEKWKGSRSVVSDSSRPYELQPIRLLRPWDFPGKSTGVGCQCLLRSIPYTHTNTKSISLPPPPPTARHSFCLDS